jgi:hypothetical protein
MGIRRTLRFSCLGGGVAKLRQRRVRPIRNRAQPIISDGYANIIAD